MTHTIPRCRTWIFAAALMLAAVLLCLPAHGVFSDVRPGDYFAEPVDWAVPTISATAWSRTRGS